MYGFKSFSSPSLVRGLFAGAVALLAVAADSGALFAHRAITPEPRNTWTSRHSRMNELARATPPEVILIGDSITDFWGRSGRDVWAEYLSPLNAANFGIGGDRTESLLWRLDHGAFEGLSPKVVVLLIGTNNSRRDSVEQITEGVTAVVERIREHTPEAKILLLGIFPRGKTAEDELNAKVMAVNEQIAQLGDNQQVFYLNIGNKFLDASGNVDPELMPDYLHLSEKGYRVWAESMQPLLLQLLGRAPVQAAK